MSRSSRASRPAGSLAASVAGTAAALLLAAASPQALAAWNESTDGDFSNDGLAASVVSLSAGSNVIWGATGRAVPGGPVDLDYFTITVPAGHQFSAMVVLEGTEAVGGGAFIGLMSGTQFTIPPSTGTADGMLGWSLFGSSNVDSDLLALMATPSFGSTGFSTPLPAGDYVFWVQETGVGSAPYGFDLQVTAVPEAPTALALMGGLALLAGALRRR